MDRYCFLSKYYYFRKKKSNTVDCAHPGWDHYADVERDNLDAHDVVFGGVLPQLWDGKDTVVGPVADDDSAAVEEVYERVVNS